ncbi:chemotaxis protein CheW [Kineococcus sp. LSe6-4]|uniref:Chemotaxis protein CheW n=1 Tax=Kineococcus halophytocola TaxID=3234027 RepID=A0ABV4H2I1_9ACTN
MSTQYATFHLAGHLFGVEVRRVQEVLTEQPRTPAPLAPHAVAGLINLRGQVVTALDLRRRLNMPDREEGKVAMNVVVRAAEEVWSLLVDSIGGVIEVTDSTFEPPPDTLSGPIRELIRGAYKLDGALLLVLDVDKALEIEGAESAA